MPMFLGTSIAILAGIGSAATVSADSPVVMDVVVGQGYFHSTAEFVTNEKAERAWVEAAVYNGGVGDDYRRETFRVKVPGLSYETRTQEIVYDNQGSRIVCARVIASRFPFTTRTQVRGTGNCRLLAHLDSRIDDNGFEYETDKHLVVELSVPPHK